jgi:hypothetical protein
MECYTKEKVVMLKGLELYNFYKFIDEHKDEIESGNLTSGDIGIQFKTDRSTVIRAIKKFNYTTPILTKKAKPENSPNSKKIAKLELKVHELNVKVRSLAIAIRELTVDCGSKLHPSVETIINELNSKYDHRMLCFTCIGSEHDCDK